MSDGTVPAPAPRLGGWPCLRCGRPVTQAGKCLTCPPGSGRERWETDPDGGDALEPRGPLFRLWHLASQLYRQHRLDPPSRINATELAALAYRWDEAMLESRKLIRQTRVDTRNWLRELTASDHVFDAIFHALGEPERATRDRSLLEWLCRWTSEMARVIEAIPQPLPWWRCRDSSHIADGVERVGRKRAALRLLTGPANDPVAAALVARFREIVPGTVDAPKPPDVMSPGDSATGINPQAASAPMTAAIGVSKVNAMNRLSRTRGVGRPREPMKAAIIARATTLRAQGFGWKKVAATIKEEFGRVYEPETLRRYCRGTKAG